MKVITKNGEYFKVNEKEADLKVTKFGYKFAPKSEWKRSKGRKTEESK